MRRFLLDTGVAGDFINRRRGIFERGQLDVTRGNPVGIGIPVLAEFVYGRNHEVLIAEEDGERVGFLLLLFDVPDEVTLMQQAFVAYTAVEPHARGRGVGRALLLAAEGSARAAGLGYVSLMVTEENAPARALYDRAGYVTERRMLTKVL